MPIDSKTHPRPVTVWLLSCCGMILVMALLGAVTRLTLSGLSMTSWDPVMGIVPPLDAAAWERAFAAYQKIPQYQILNRGMTLEEFKGIFFWEWLHRLWGRLIGVVFLVPLLVFLARRQIDRATGLKFAAIFALGGLQGFIGWFMVQSGLTVLTSVSPYRLALHLGFALAIYGILLWAALDGMAAQDMRTDARMPVAASLRGHGWAALGLLAITMIWGAFVAGLHAGEAFNTWPLMEGAVVPDGAISLQPLWRNFFENTALVQFMHRWLGPGTMLVLLGWVARCWRIVEMRRGLGALGVMAVVQVLLGITTLLSHVEIIVAVVHQAGAITLLSLLLFNLRNLCGSRTERK